MKLPPGHKENRPELRVASFSSYQNKANGETTKKKKKIGKKKGDSEQSVENNFQTNKTHT